MHRLALLALLAFTACADHKSDDLKLGKSYDMAQRTVHDARSKDFVGADDGVTYTFTTTAHTTNIPTGTARTFGYGGSVIKTVGTAEAQFRMLYTGSIGWM